jgi:hypothetical protein
MGATLAWATTILLAVGGVFLLFYLGVDLPTALHALISGVAHALGSPLAAL